MRIFVLALLGGLACGLFGSIWRWQDEKTTEVQLQRLVEKEGIRQPTDDQVDLLRLLYGVDMRQLPEMIARRRQLTSPLLVAFPAALLGGILALLRRRRVAGPVLLLCAAGGLFFAGRASEFFRKVLMPVAGAVGAIALGGLLSFLIRPLPGEAGAAPEGTEAAALPKRRKREPPRPWPPWRSCCWSAGPGRTAP
jgi:hypothetical protein